MLKVECSLVCITPAWVNICSDDPAKAEAIKQEYGDGSMTLLRGLTMVKTAIHLDIGDIVDGESEVDIEIDNLFVDLENHSSDVYMLVIYYYPPVSGDNEQTWDIGAEGLLLVRRATPEHAFERIG